MNTPKLRFKEFTDKWQEKKLGEFANSISSGRSSTQSTSEGNFSIFGSTGRIGTSNSFDYSGDKILVARVGANAGTIYRALGKYSVSDNTLILELKNNLNINFSFYLLKKSNIKKLVFGSGQPLITGGQLKVLKISIPTKIEQQKIADFLTAVDEKITKLEEKKKGFEKYKKGVMQAIFSQKIRFKKPDGSNFPNWEEKRLGELFQQAKGSGLSWEQVSDSGANKCVLYGELYTTYDEIITKVKSRTDVTNGVKSKKGDLLVPCSTTTTGIDLANVSEVVEEGILIGSDITILRSMQKINSTFWAYYLTHYKKFELAKYAQGSTIVHLYYGHFKKIKLDIPRFKEQEKIAEFLIILDNKINLINKELEQVKFFKKSLLQQMFV